MKRQRRPLTSEETVKILKRHLVDKVLVSNLCDELDLQPTVFYRWQTEFLEKGAPAFARPRDSRQRKQEQRITELEEKEIPASRFLVWLELPASKYYAWQVRYGKVNEHNGLVSRDFWLDAWEKEAIIAFLGSHSLEG